MEKITKTTLNYILLGVFIFGISTSHLITPTNLSTAEDFAELNNDILDVNSNVISS
ncbi:MAG: hypothetical protein ACTSRK_18695 [Promethearchaeota archaeon]